ncbi:hypothetical protein MHBO_001871 [Bonamia ostreae]|uniref:Uncharacterized protein n=1 Tax=Bonamia ostreae TaxID=126728 RepID=A0ABV2AKH3_9EUKA
MVVTQNRTIESLLRDLKEIQIACVGEEKETDSKLDDFQKAKLDLSENLMRIKNDLEFAEKNPDKKGDLVRVKLRAQKDFETAAKCKKQLEKAIRKNERDFSKNYKRKKLTVEVMEERREVYALLTKDFNYVESVLKRKAEMPKMKSGAQTEREKRLQERKEKLRKKKKRGESDDDDYGEERMLTKEEQIFLQRSLENDRKIVSLVH